MENTIHAQKVAILSRLIKESSLTLEEALLLLKEEGQVMQPLTVPPVSVPFNQPYWYGSPSTIVGGTGTVTTTNAPDGTIYTAQTALQSLFGDLQTD